MDATHTLEQWFERADQAMPVVTEAARVGLVLAGVLLGLIGGRLVKATCVIGGLMLGMIVGGLTLAFVESAGIGVGIMVGLGLLGMLCAWLMFRVWVAMAAALMFAIAAAAGVLVWQGVSTDQLAQDTQATANQLQSRYDVAADELNDEVKLQVQSLIQQGDAESLTEADELLAKQGYEAVESARGVIFRNIESMGDWWEQNSTDLQRQVGLAMLIGAGLGLLFGVLAPDYTVSVQSAIVGSVLIVIPGRELVMTRVPQLNGLLPTSAHGTLVLIGLITAILLSVQWTLYLRRVDREK